MMQKVVIKVSMNNQKSRSKSLKIAVGVSETAALVGQEKDQIEVTGEGIDAVKLTTLLRKSIGFAELVSVGPLAVDEEEEEEEGSEKEDAIIPHMDCQCGVPFYQTHEFRVINLYQDPYNCSVM